jgi:hypothetical protein
VSQLAPDPDGTTPTVPLTYKNAMASNERERWIDSMNDEMNSIEQNSTWELVEELPKERKL